MVSRSYNRSSETGQIKKDLFSCANNGQHPH